MKLVLAEKPSVAQSIAKVLGAAKREDGYLEGNGYVVSWCVGHLVELAQPEVYDAKYSKWAYADLPIFPMDWQYEVSAGTKKQFGILKKLMAREDVASLVCATDAGREGELIFRLVYHKAGCRKPFERLWISSMEDVAIKEGFENLRSGTEYDALYSSYPKPDNSDGGATLFLAGADHGYCETKRRTRQNNLQSATVSLQVVIGLCKRKETAALKSKPPFQMGVSNCLLYDGFFSFAVVWQSIIQYLIQCFQ